MSRPLRLAFRAWMLLGSAGAGLGLVGCLILMFGARDPSTDVRAALGAYGGFILAFVMAPAAAWMAERRGRQAVAALFMLVSFAMIWGLIVTAGDLAK